MLPRLDPDWEHFIFVKRLFFSSWEGLGVGSDFPSWEGLGVGSDFPSWEGLGVGSSSLRSLRPWRAAAPQNDFCTGVADTMPSGYTAFRPYTQNENAPP